MTDYGSIAIDNKNLLNDLLGLEINESNQELQPRPLINPYILQNQADPQSNYMPIKSRKILLESPTFSKKEDDIYRYVHSRISNADISLNNGNELKDSLEHLDENELRKNLFFENNQRL
ncbi:unnamed protein product [Brachionus calyciflorus]|uniref:Uncharacterized protein n=1 Tax=Brachionus calyciflorus TaxID=104777 RepID=A0A814I4E9_9BILA|nr:unnamed protein product [Brachionus calyciflorus]